MVKNKKMKLGWLEQSDASAVKLDTSGLLGESEKSPITAFEQWLRITIKQLLKDFLK